MEALLGCWREAQRADKVAVQLVRIRREIDLEFYDHITAVLREIESTSRLLRDIYDLFTVYRSRVPVILYYLNVLLPSLCKSLKDMILYLEHDRMYSILAYFIFHKSRFFFTVPEELWNIQPILLLRIRWIK
jgi:hypothetical protein